MFLLKKSFYIVCAVICINTYASAKENAFIKNAQYSIGMGAGVTYLNDYIGSDESNAYVFPFPFIYFKSDKFKIDRNAFEGNVFTNKKWHLSFDVAGSLPVNSKNNKAREGMPDLDWVGEMGPSIEYYVQGDTSSNNRLYIDWSIRKAVATNFKHINSIGWVSQLSLNQKYQVPRKIFGGDFVIDSSISVLYNSSQYSRYYYDVSIEHENYLREQYTASSGYAGVRLAIGGTWRKDNYWIGVFTRYSNLNGVAFENSPLVKKNHNVLFGFAVSYIFLSN
jgi:outer membrane scaffolding protein for murein synthesis (MipA/OmpV family)